MVIGAIEAGYGDDRAEYGRVCLHSPPPSKIEQGSKRKEKKEGKK